MCALKTDAKSKELMMMFSVHINNETRVSNEAVFQEMFLQGIKLDFLRQTLFRLRKIVM